MEAIAEKPTSAISRIARKVIKDISSTARAAAAAKKPLLSEQQLLRPVLPGRERGY